MWLLGPFGNDTGVFCRGFSQFTIRTMTGRIRFHRETNGIPFYIFGVSSVPVISNDTWSFRRPLYSLFSTYVLFGFVCCFYGSDHWTVVYSKHLLRHKHRRPLLCDRFYILETLILVYIKIKGWYVFRRIVRLPLPIVIYLLLLTYLNVSSFCTSTTSRIHC